MSTRRAGSEAPLGGVAAPGRRRSAGGVAVPVSLDHAAAIVLLHRAPAILETIVAGFPPDLVDQRPAPDEWSAAEILAHLVEVEDLLFRRVESMIASDRAPASTKPAEVDRPGVAELLNRWLTARRQTLERLDRLTPADLEHGAELRRWGTVNVAQQVCEWAYHDLEHVRQLLAAEEAFLYPSIGGFAGLYPPPYSPSAGARR